MLKVAPFGASSHPGLGGMASQMFITYNYFILVIECQNLLCLMVTAVVILSINAKFLCFLLIELIHSLQKIQVVILGDTIFMISNEPICLFVGDCNDEFIVAGANQPLWRGVLGVNGHESKASAATSHHALSRS